MERRAVSGRQSGVLLHGQVVIIVIWQRENVLAQILSRLWRARRGGAEVGAQTSREYSHGESSGPGCLAPGPTCLRGERPSTSIPPSGVPASWETAAVVVAAAKSISAAAKCAVRRPACRDREQLAGGAAASGQRGRKHCDSIPGSRNAATAGSQGITGRDKVGVRKTCTVSTAVSICDA